MCRSDGGCEITKYPQKALSNVEVQHYCLPLLRQACEFPCLWINPNVHAVRKVFRIPDDGTSKRTSCVQGILPHVHFSVARERQEMHLTRLEAYTQSVGTVRGAFDLSEIVHSQDEDWSGHLGLGDGQRVSAKNAPAWCPPPREHTILLVPDSVLEKCWCWLYRDLEVPCGWAKGWICRGN